LFRGQNRNVFILKLVCLEKSIDSSFVFLLCWKEGW